MQAERGVPELKSGGQDNVFRRGPLAAALQEELDRVQAHAVCVQQDGHAAAEAATLDGRAEDILAGLQAIAQKKPVARRDPVGGAEPS